MRAEGNRNRIVRHGAIEIMPIGKAFVIESKILHRAAMGDDPRSFGRASGGIGEALQDIGDGMHVDVKIAAVDQLHLRRAFFREMHVSVGEAPEWPCGLGDRSLECRAGEAANFVGTSRGDDARTRRRRALRKLRSRWRRCGSCRCIESDRDRVRVACSWVLNRSLLVAMHGESDTLSSFHEQLAHQILPLAELHFKFFEREFFIEVNLFELLLSRSSILARRPESTFHHQLLSFL